MPEILRPRAAPRDSGSPDTLRPTPSPSKDDATPHGKPRRRLERSLYRWKDYQNWAERVRNRWEDDR